jgi:polar amino acid transport system substrate-binding protein
MKTFIKRLSTGLLTVAALASLAVSADAKTKVVVATDSDTAPFTYKEGDKFAGYDIDVVKAIFKGSEDYEIAFETVPFSSILTGIDAGRYQIGANYFNYNEERAEKYLFSDPISKSNYAVATAKGAKVKSLADLAGKTAEAIAGSNYAQILEKWNKDNPKKKITINYVSDKTGVVTRLQRVESGAIDFILYDAISIEHIKDDQGIDIAVNQLTDDIGGDKDGLEYLVFAKDEAGEEWRDYVNDRIEELTEDGTLTKLSKKHFGGDFTVKDED